MADRFAIAVIALFVAIFAGRLISERGMRALTADQKARFLDAFATQRKYSLLPLIAVILVTFLFPRKLPLWALMSALVVYIIGLSAFGIRKMRSIELPPVYIRAYTTGQAVQVGGLLFFFAALQGWIL